jgi:hypothetical protein
MRHLRLFESDGQDFTLLRNQSEFYRTVFNPSELPNRPVCMSKEEVLTHLSRVNGMMGLNPSSSMYLSNIPGAGRLGIQNVLKEPPSNACLVGFEALYPMVADQELVSWQPRFGGRTFTRSGLIDDLVEWLDAGNSGTYLDFLVHAGRVTRVVVDGIPMYKNPWHTKPVGARKLRGQHSGFFSDATQAGIISLRREGRRHIIVPGANFQAFKDNRLRARNKYREDTISIYAVFLNDDWIAVSAHFTLSSKIKQSHHYYRCDSIRGLRAAVTDAIKEYQRLVELGLRM